jgi:hypothetical protein
VIGCELFVFVDLKQAEQIVQIFQNEIVMTEFVVVADLVRSALHLINATQVRVRRRRPPFIRVNNYKDLNEGAFLLV